MLKPIEVNPLNDYRIWVKYSDGTEGVADLSDLAGDGVFSLWNDYREFKKVHLGPAGEIAWNDQVEICSDSIYLKMHDLWEQAVNRQSLYKLPPLK